jgi:hypothetical protein
MVISHLGWKRFGQEWSFSPPFTRAKESKEANVMLERSSRWVQIPGKKERSGSCRIAIAGDRNVPKAPNGYFLGIFFSQTGVGFSPFLSPLRSLHERQTAEASD